MVGLDHFLELTGWAAGRLVVGKAAIRREVVEGHVAPVVVTGVRVWVCIIGVILRFLHRQKFDCGDTQAGQIRGLQTRTLVGAAVDRRDAGVVHGQAAHMGLINDVVLEGACWLGAGRLGVGSQHDALGRYGTGIQVAVQRAAGVHGAVGHGHRHRVMAQLAGIRVGQQLVGIEVVASGIDIGDEAHRRTLGPASAVRPVGTPGTVTIVDRAGDAVALQGGDRNAQSPDVAGALDHDAGSFLLCTRGAAVQIELDALGAAGIDLEIHVGPRRVITGAQLIGVNRGLGQRTDPEKAAHHRGKENSAEIH